MKKLIIIIILGVLCSNIQAQTNRFPPPPNGHYANNRLDKFIGIWVWVSGTDTLKIVLKKDIISLPFNQNSTSDALLGFHIFKQGGVVIESSIEYAHTIYADKLSTILAGNNDDDDPSEISGTMKNIVKGNKLGQIKMIMNIAQNEISFSIENSEGLKLEPYDSSFSYPRNLVLKRM